MALAGITVLEFAGLAPVPFCGLLLADFGANVIRIDRSQPRSMPDFLARGKRSLAIDLKSARAKDVLLRLVKQVFFRV